MDAFFGSFGTLFSYRCKRNICFTTFSVKMIFVCLALLDLSRRLGCLVLNLAIVLHFQRCKKANYNVKKHSISKVNCSRLDCYGSKTNNVSVQV